MDLEKKSTLKQNHTGNILKIKTQSILNIYRKRNGNARNPCQILENVQTETTQQTHNNGVQTTA
jgi:hypothetical protein